MPTDAPQRLLRGGRMLKRWRYVGVFCEQLMACAARVHVGPARQWFWALYPREPGAGQRPGAGARGGGEALRERTHLLCGARAVQLTEGVLRVRDEGVELELVLREEAGVEARCLHRGGVVWTRKQAGIEAVGTLALDGAPARAIEARAVIDDTAGYHARETEWWWSAGVGSGRDGTALAWNLVSGVNDPPSGSERAVWVAGVPGECAPVSFSADLARICGADGAVLAFHAEAQRARSENLLLVRSNYVAPFGTFSGTLPGPAGAAPVALAHGLGVVEHHRARW